MSDFDVFALPDDWETLADAGRAVMDDMDSGRWLAGDIATRVARRYGEDSLGKFASDIGMARASTLRDYARVARRFEIAVRNAFPALSFSHFRTAMRAGDDAELYLTQAQDNGWPVAELHRQIAAAIGAPVPQRKLWEGRVALGIDQNGDRILYYCDEPFTGLGPQDMVYRAVVYAVETEAE